MKRGLENTSGSKRVGANQRRFSCRSLAPSAVKKRKITQQIMSIALEHQFVTPLTTLLVESQDATERLLADSPKDPKQGCCPGRCPTVSITTVWEG